MNILDYLNLEQKLKINTMIDVEHITHKTLSLN